MPDKKPLLFKTPESKNFNYLDFTNDGIFQKINPIIERIKFWNNIFEDYKYLWNTTFNFNLP